VKKKKDMQQRTLALMLLKTFQLMGPLQSSRGISFFDRDVDAAYPCIIHSHVCNEISVRVYDRDIHRLTYLSRLCLRCRDDCLSILERYHFVSISSA